MKSLKRTLCLVLALVMVLGLFGIASATNFTDDDTIQYKEAVEVITGIGAINGMGDGTFNPKGTITRAQAATMVTRVALTAGVAADLTGIESSFTDVTVEGGFGWAIPSIEYMVKEGIINGRGDGTFDPNGQINGYAVLKMLLCVLGYGKQSEYIGDQWTLQVAVDASKKDNNLLAGRVAGSPLLSQPATREEVALYCFNALSAKPVTYSKLNDTYTPKGNDFGTEVYGLKTAEGVVTSNGAISAAAAKNGLTVIGASDTYAINTGLDLVGHYVKVYYRDDTPADVAAAGNTPLAGVGFSVVDTSTVVNVAKPIDTAAKWAAAFGTGTITKDDTATRTVDGTYDVGAPGAISGLTIGSAALPGTYILNKNAIVAYIQPAAYKSGVVSAYKAPTATAAGRLTLVGGASAKSVDIPATGNTSTTAQTFNATHKFYDGIQVGDVVTVRTVGGYETYEKATSVTGTVTNYKVADSVTTVVVDGTTYTMAASAALVGDAVTGGTVTTATVGDSLVNGKYNAYVGPDGKVVAFVAAGDAVNGHVLMYVTDAWADAPVAGSYGTQTVTSKVQGVNIETGEKVEYIVDVQSVSGSAYATQLDADGVVGDAAFDSAKATAIKAKFYYAELKKNDTLGIEYADIASAKATPAPLSDGADKWGTGKSFEAVGASANAALTAASKYTYDSDHATNGYKYLSENTKFVYINGTGKDLKINVLPYPQTVDSSTAYTVLATKVSATSKNSDVNYIVLVNKMPTTTNKDIIFVPKFTTTDKVSFTPAGETTAISVMQQVGFVNGTINPSIKIANTVNDKDGNAIGDLSTIAGKPCFFTYTVNAQGLYALKQIDTAEANVGTVKELHNGLISTAAVADPIANPISYAGAKFVDVKFVTGQSTVEHTIDSLKFGDTIAWHITTDPATSVQTVDTIYYLDEAKTEATLTKITVEPAGGSAQDVTANSTTPQATTEISCAASTALTLTYTASEGATVKVYKAADDGTTKGDEITLSSGKNAYLAAPSTFAASAKKDIGVIIEVTSGDGQTTNSYGFIIKLASNA